MVAVRSSLALLAAERIPYVTAGEAHALLQVELDRLLALLETLAPADWSRPTACTQWDVHAMVAHQAGGYASGTGYLEMFRQYAVIPRRGQLIEDAINARQVGERRGQSPSALIAELRRVGPQAIQKWAYRFRVAKPLALPHPVGGLLSLRHLMWVIHSRDTWMHRLDICRAVGRAFEQTPAHDGRIVALIVRDVHRRLARRLAGQAFVLELRGPAGGVWQLGPGQPRATLRMDALDFSIFASGRFSFAEMCARAQFSGDTARLHALLHDLLVLF